LIFLCLFLSGVALSGAAVAEEEWGYKLSHELMTGRSEEEVKAELYQDYGDVLRASPLVRGGGQWAYIIPVVLIIIGAAVMVFFLKRQRVGADTSATGPVVEGPPVEEDPELARIIDQELSS
jgi:cytochrome c-type biogenesis protein CcmH/NrfF